MKSFVRFTTPNLTKCSNPLVEPNEFQVHRVYFRLSPFRLRSYNVCFDKQELVKFFELGIMVTRKKHVDEETFFCFYINDGDA